MEREFRFGCLEMDLEMWIVDLLSGYEKYDAFWSVNGGERYVRLKSTLLKWEYIYFFTKITL